MRAAVAGIRGRRAVVVDYDRFLEEPVGELERMATQLKLTVRPEMATDLPRYCARLVDTSLRHGTFDEAALYGDARVPDSVKDLYRALKMVARELAGLPALVERTARAEPSGADYPWLARALPFVEDELVRARAGLAELTAEIAEARRSHAGRDAIEAALREQIARTERDLADERTTIASLTQQLDFARSAAEDHLQEIATARANIEALVGEIDVARAGADIQNQQIEAARSHIEALGEEIAVARAGAEDQQRQIEAAQARIEALVSRIEDASRSAAERARRESELRTDVVRLAEEAGVLRSERDALAPALRETQEAAATIAADRDRLVQLERGARERSALLDGRIAALESDVRATRARDEVNAAELSRLSRTWYGRLARRLARPR
jgi:predicted  nucleic acid-binding Zn-ribbon protein